MTIANNNMMASNGFPNPYVNDSLVAMWDGQWNNGFGSHAPKADVWRDIVSNVEMTAVGSPHFSDKCCQFDGRSYFTAQSSLVREVIQSRHWTCECVCQLKDSHTMTYPGAFCFCQPRGCAFNYNCESMHEGTIKSCAMENGWFDFMHSEVLSMLQVSFALDGQNRSVKANGDDCTGSFNLASSIQTSNCFIGAFSYETDAVPTAIGYFIGDVYCIRLYSRMLTDAERKQNFDVDTTRFFIQSDM